VEGEIFPVKKNSVKDKYNFSPTAVYLLGIPSNPREERPAPACRRRCSSFLPLLVDTLEGRAGEVQSSAYGLFGQSRHEQGAEPPQLRSVLARDWDHPPQPRGSRDALEVAEEELHQLADLLDNLQQCKRCKKRACEKERKLWI